MFVSNDRDKTQTPRQHVEYLRNKPDDDALAKAMPY